MASMPSAYHSLFVVFAVLFGATVGSFLNVCIYRLPRECLSIVWPGSHCPACQRPIRWFENIPLLSYAALRGRCRGCGGRIPLRYPLVEGLTAALFGLAAWMQAARVTPGTLPDAIVVFSEQAFILSLLVVATFIDLDHRIIPAELTRWPMWLAPAVAAIFPALHAPFAGAPLEQLARISPRLAGASASLLGIAAGLGIVYAVRVFGGILFRREAMGLGDVWYLGMLGGYLGWKGALLVFITACFFGALIGGLIWLLTGDRTMAFGPYLSLAAGVVLLFRPALLDGIARYADWVRGMT